MASFLKTYLMQTRSSPTALSPPLLHCFLNTGVHKFSEGYLSPWVPSEPVTNACSGPLCCMRSVQTQGVALPSISSQCLQGWAPPSLQQGWLEPLGPTNMESAHVLTQVGFSW